MNIALNSTCLNDMDSDEQLSFWLAIGTALFLAMVA